MELRERFTRLYKKKVIAHLVTAPVAKMWYLLQIKLSSIFVMVVVAKEMFTYTVLNLNEKFRGFKRFELYTDFVLKHHLFFNNLPCVYTVL